MAKLIPKKKTTSEGYWLEGGMKNLTPRQIEASMGGRPEEPPKKMMKPMMPKMKSTMPMDTKKKEPSKKLKPSYSYPQYA